MNKEYKVVIENAALDMSGSRAKPSDPVWDELDACEERIKKLEKRYKECPVWFTVERKKLKKQISDEKDQYEKLVYRMCGCGNGQIEIR